jgi:ferredoxin
VTVRVNGRCEERGDEAIREPSASPGSLRYARNDDRDSEVTAVVQISRAIRDAGLVSRGAFHLADADRTVGLETVATIVLIGVAGRQGWSAFAESSERRDGAPHPLDRWSRRVIDRLAFLCGGRALYPFGGPPYWPFQQWAMRAEPVAPSPLGLLIHPEYGLWHSYRGALAFEKMLAIPAFEPQPSPCESCAAQPCLSACPVGAFSRRGYDSARCATYLRSEDGRDCMEGGCLARRACPAGADHRPDPDQASFHMRAFLTARDAKRA